MSGSLNSPRIAPTRRSPVATGAVPGSSPASAAKCWARSGRPARRDRRRRGSEASLRSTSSSGNACQATRGRGAGAVSAAMATALCHPAASATPVARLTGVSRANGDNRRRHCRCPSVATTRPDKAAAASAQVVARSPAARALRTARIKRQTPAKPLIDSKSAAHTAASHPCATATARSPRSRPSSTSSWADASALGGMRARVSTTWPSSWHPVTTSAIARSVTTSSASAASAPGELPWTTTIRRPACPAASSTLSASGSGTHPTSTVPTSTPSAEAIINPVSASGSSGAGRSRTELSSPSTACKAACHSRPSAHSVSVGWASSTVRWSPHNALLCTTRVSAACSSRSRSGFRTSTPSRARASPVPEA